MIWRLFFILLLIPNLLALPYKDDYLNQLVLKFVYSNEKLCGDPFSDPAWLPALEDCTLQCEETKYICKQNTDIPDMQLCDRLPHKCIVSLRKSLGWSEDHVEENNVVAQANFPELAYQYFDDSNRKRKNDYNFDNSAVIKSTEIDVQFSSETITEDDLAKSSYPISSNQEESISYNAAEEQTGNSNIYNSDSMNETSTATTRIEAHIYTAATTTVSSVSYIREPVPPTKSEAKVFKYPLPARSISNQVEGPPEDPYVSNNYDSVEATFTTTTRKPSRVFMPSIRPGPAYNKPALDAINNGNEPTVNVENERLSKNSLHKHDNEAKIVDKSGKCCEWALQGLCDQHWQVVRRLCPVSCGTLECDEIEGIKTCHRVINIDIEQCFENARVSRSIDEKPKISIDLVDDSHNVFRFNRRRRML